MTGPGTVLALAVAAGLGSTIRYLLGQRWDRERPDGTLAANTAGSLLVGVLLGAGVPASVWTWAAVGFCGGLTTFSTWMVQSVRSEPGAESRVRWRVVVTTLVLALAACTAGWCLGRVLG